MTEQATIRDMCKALTEEIASTRRTLGIREGTLSGLQDLCTHPSRKSEGHDPRGRGSDHYSCPDCRREWSE